MVLQYMNGLAPSSREEPISVRQTRYDMTICFRRRWMQSEHDGTEFESDQMIRYRCIYPNGDVKQFYTLPEPPPNGRWSFKYCSNGENVFVLKLPPVEITFKTESGTWKYMSDKIPFKYDLPPIPPREGEVGEWDIPEDLSKPIVIIPTYHVETYVARFIDGDGETRIRFSKDSPLRVPDVTPMPNMVGKWEPFEIEYRNLVIHAVYEPRRIKFMYDGKEEVQLYSSCNPPQLEPKPGFTRKWKIPYEPGNFHVELTPSELPILYKIVFRETDFKSQTVGFNLTMSSIKEPETSSMPDTVAYWSPPYDLSCPKDQECRLMYRPVRLLLHNPGGAVSSLDYHEGIELPEIEGYTWPSYQLQSKDIDLYPIPKVCFALFYVNADLRFIVPYTNLDRHYVKEMLDNCTVPPYKRKTGTWVLKRSDGDFEYYVADYSASIEAQAAYTPSVDWSVEGLADYLYNNGSTIVLEEMPLDLFNTSFSEVSGLTRENLKSQRSLPLREWLKREKVGFLDEVKSYRVSDTDEGLTLCLTGKFTVVYEGSTIDAVDFLQEYDVMFREQPFIDRTHWVKKLQPNIQIDSYEDAQDAFRKLYPVDKMIPPLRTVSTKYYHYIETPSEAPVFSIDRETIKEMKQSNERIVHVFNTDFHDELEVKVLDEVNREVEITKYKGDDALYEIPSSVLVDKFDSEGYTVVRIGGNSFADNKTLESVIMPETVRSIGFQAFVDCKKLSDVELNEGLENIGAWSFMGCKHLTVLTIPSTVKLIDEYALTSLREVRMKCPKEVLHRDSISNDCTVIELDKEAGVAENVVEESSMEETDDEADPIGSLDRESVKFIRSLDDVERGYIRTVINGKDPKQYAAGKGQKQDMIELRINEKFSEAFDDSAQIIDEGTIDEDYVELLRCV